MKGTMLTRKVFDREVFFYLPSGYDDSDKRYPIVYAQDGDKFKGFLTKIIDDIEIGFSNGSLEEHILVGITPIDRLSEYTPWFSKALNERFNDFGGQADNYLRFLLKDLQPYIENEFRVSVSKEDRKIMGYSLGALVSLYSIYKNNNYSKIASICSSQWYENWIKFMDEEEIINDNFKIIIIAGRKEGYKKTTIHKYAPKFSEKSYEIFKKRIGEKNIKMIWDEYDHHENILNRYKIALEFLLSKI
ncbi:alpha/beta hydrolase [Clostridium beijerinckii]|uniref:alpha/beta hydrolase n=1 Tax=Clostridium beijerinckii TaxID=1520 RepID=UPI00098C025D|nr:alpha/beta hydrolase-fold protein [Clostridium beijerinckii]MBA8932788.1 putative alpha/beta superfamily hydrolase [Clostridium beijerinckii]NOW06262.1 putative alpha/beta superfamily hydrolase [Clostridium beijerinckii]NRT37254.1 putative alpha/beta superfamily hydrolase [Clostridium beijerinckii]NRT43312.1 putative alpha/beta superfamily hydrolase [Clostridium beijerinckii]NRU36991.1 putative alpha/beta superfamily hydrolase [Clostridium beijerinckii]